MTSFQALSGAGYPGVPSLDIQENVIPFISGEEEKVAAETNKILGSLGKDKIRPKFNSCVLLVQQGSGN